MIDCSDNLFCDPLVDALKAGGSRCGDNGVRVRLPRVFGFCGGVTRAVDLLQRELATADRPIWLLGPIIHNDAVNAWFRDHGVHILPEDDPGQCLGQAAPTDCFVIPAFGLPLTVQNRLSAFVDPDGRIVDTTCPYVTRIWDFVGDRSAHGRTIVIHGKPGHPETNGILSRSLTPRNGAVLVPDLAHARILAEDLRRGEFAAYPRHLSRNPDVLCLRDLASVNQTTMLYAETEQIEDLLRQAAAQSDGRLETMNTVCRATQERQDAARQLCEQGCDAYVVVGGFDSSNTNRLYAMARAAGPAYFIRDADAIENHRIHHYDPDTGHETTTPDWLPSAAADIGVLAGASCPDRIIGNVVRTLQAAGS